MQRILKVKVKTRAKKEGIIELGVDEFEVRVNVPPVEGKANKRVIELLSIHFKIPKSQIILSKGEKSTVKTFIFNVE